jgi:hypothetical protein
MDQAVIVPVKFTVPSGPKSKWLSSMVHGLGPRVSESFTASGTVFSIFSKMVKQVFSKFVAEDIALMVALPSEEKIWKSDLSVTLCPTTRGLVVFPERYSLTPTLSKTPGVLSNVIRPEVLSLG